MGIHMRASIRAEPLLGTNCWPPTPPAALSHYLPNIPQPRCCALDVSMAHYSDKVLSEIQRYPLQPALAAVSSSLAALAQDLSRTDARNTLSNLLGALQIHPVARVLELPRSRRSAAGELALLFARLQLDDCNLEPFLVLVRTIVNDLSDRETWDAVLQLIEAFAASTPPSSFGPPPNFGGTPHTYSSSSHLGSEQTRRLLEAALRDELADCSYVKVAGFFEKYFEAPSWNVRTFQIYEAAKTLHRDGAWEGLRGSPSEQDIWSWVSRFQTQYLQDTPSVYCTTHGPQDLEGSGTKRQLDIFTIARSAQSGRKHQWAQVRVLGESSKAENFAAKFLQLARYARDVFIAQPMRKFIHGFVLLGSTMELHVFDRAGSYSAEPFNIHDAPERFIRVIAGYALMGDEELGLPDFVCHSGKPKSITAEDSVTGSERCFEFQEPPIAMRRAIVCRGTCCYLTIGGDILKLSWPPTGRLLEADLLRQAHARGVQGVARLVASRRLVSVSELRKGLTFVNRRQMQSRLRDASDSQSASSSLLSDPLATRVRPGRSQRKILDASERSSSKRPRLHSSLSKSLSKNTALGDAPFRDRTLSCMIIAPAGRPLHQYYNVREALQAIRDSVQAHWNLFEKGNILHRDISDNNIIITDPTENDGFTGMIIDLDLAVTLGEDGTPNRSGAEIMTGTLKFMSIKILEIGLRDARRDVQHTYRDDLESLFYVFLTTCINDGRSTEQQDPLRGWYTDSYKYMIGIKRGQMGRGGFESLILPEFGPRFERAKNLACNLRDILFHEGALFTDTDPNHAKVYEDVIGAFDDALEGMN